MESINRRVQKERTMGEAPDLWVVEYSERQGQFHIQTIGESCEGNLERYLDGSGPGDWVPLGLFESPEQANQFVDKVTGLKAAKQ
jgi:hypothetical protein